MRFDWKTGLGLLVTVALFAVLVWRAFGIARAAAQQGKAYQAYLAFGIGFWLGLQVFVNIAVNMGLLPTKGLTLPLMSYGRSSLVITCITLALLFRIHHELVSAGKTATSRAGSKSRGKSR